MGGSNILATSIDFKNYMEDQLQELESIRFKKMFGEYGVFYREKMVAVLADNKFYVKPTKEGELILEMPIYEAFYEKGKPYFLIEDTDDKALLFTLIKLTYDVLPIPKEKKKMRK